MKKLFTIATLLVACLSSNVSAEELTFRGISMKGKTVGQVAEIMEDSLGFSPIDEATFNGVYADRSVIVGAENVKLRRKSRFDTSIPCTRIFLTVGDYNTKSIILESYEGLKKLLTEKFGKPNFDSETGFWANDDKSKQIYETKWVDKESKTEILLYLAGVENSTIFYVPAIIFRDKEQEKIAFDKKIALENERKRAKEEAEEKAIEKATEEAKQRAIEKKEAQKIINRSM